MIIIKIIIMIFFSSETTLETRIFRTKTLGQRDRKQQHQQWQRVLKMITYGKFVWIYGI